MLASNAQQSEWENNIYVVTTTRIFVVVGAVYLFRSLYYLITRYSGPVIGTIQHARVSSLESYDLTINFEDTKLNLPAVLQVHHKNRLASTSTTWHQTP